MSDTAAPAAPKTRAELVKLQQDWLADPHWDIQDTPGFETHREELTDFAQEHLRKVRARERLRLDELAESLGFPGNRALAEQWDQMLKRIQCLEAQVAAQAAR